MKIPISIPNILTLFRMGLVPVMVIAYYVPYEGRYLLTAAIFTLASVTDWLDGLVARRLNQTTRFGAFLDPVADKLIVVVALVLLVQAHASAWLAIPALVIVCREIMVTALREWMADMGNKAHVKVSYIGKVKTFVQMCALIVLLANAPDLSKPQVLIGYGLLYMAALLTIWSMFIYLQIAWPSISNHVDSQ
jgi:CDP-diacylglycerol--glycerol-3-phosphate 3-phosphatidyltransferase